MRVTVGQEQLHRALGHVARVVGTRVALGAPSTVLLATDAGRLRLAATNLEVSVTCWVDCAVDGEGAVAVPVRLLVDVVAALPSEALRLDLDPGTLALRLYAWRGETICHATIRGNDSKDFPNVGSPPYDRPGALTASIAPDLLREMIGRTVFAAADEGGPTVLTGIHARFADGRLTLAATDRHRVALCGVELERAPEGDLAVIVPTRALSELSRASGEVWEPVAVAVAADRRQLRGRAGPVEVRTQLLEGNFPDVAGLIPRRHDTRTVADRATLQDLLRLALLFARGDGDRVRVTLAPGAGGAGGCLVLGADGAEAGDSAGRLSAEVTGPRGDFLFNGRYLRDALSAVRTAQVALETRGPTGAVVIRPVGDGDLNHTQLVMPLHPALTTASA